jgi:hypothetical protein
VRKIRSYLRRTGTTSIEAAIEGDTHLGGSVEGDTTLGGLATSTAVISKGGERLLRFADARRWVAEVDVSVYHSPLVDINDIADALAERVASVQDLEVRSEPEEGVPAPTALILLRSTGQYGE